ncbi:MAG: hypothetical protein IPP28_00115 [Xanthomonadales bacterium]|nr:hypothetical protein [Xanthomonadales bacterium]
MRILLPALLALCRSHVRFGGRAIASTPCIRGAVHVSHLGFSESEGEFHDLRGGFRFDRDDWSSPAAT